MISQAELESLLKTLCRDQLVNLGVGDPISRGWFRAQVVSHDAATGRLVLTYIMDRPSDRPLEPGERVVVSAIRMDDATQSAPMCVEHSSGGLQPTIELRVTLEIRHVRPDNRSDGTWRAGGLFRNLLPADHERVVRFIFAELRSRQQSH